MKAKALALIESRKFWAALATGLVLFLETGNWRNGVIATLTMIFGGLAAEDFGKNK